MSENIKKLAALFAPVSSAVLVAEDGVIQYMNQAAIDLIGPHLGFPAAELLGEGAGSVKIGQDTFSVRSAGCEGAAVYYIESPDGPGGVSAPYNAQLRHQLQELFAELKNHIVSLSTLLLDMTEQGVWEQTGRANDGNALGRLAEEVHRDSAVMERMLSCRFTMEALISGRRQPECVNLDAAVFCKQLASTVGFFARRRGINVTHTCAFGETVPATFDPALMELALLQLIYGSLSHMSAGKTLSLSVRNDGEQTIFSVNDDGGGPACSSDGSGRLTSSFAGVIVAMHGGALACKSLPGKGSFVSCSLPRRPDVSLVLDSDGLLNAVGGIQTVLTELSPWLEPEDFDPRLMD